MPDDDFICPACGSAVPSGAHACPDCGSDENTGWSKDTVYDGTGIDDPDDFDYDEFVAREFGGQPRAGSSRARWGGWFLLLVALVLIIFILTWVLR